MPDLNLTDLQNAGSDAYVARLLSDNYLPEEVISHLWDRFPTAYPQSIDAAYQRGLAAWQAASIYNSTTLKGLPNVADIPRLAGGIGRFQYTVEISVLDTSTGKQDVRAVQFRSDNLLTREEVVAQVNVELDKLQADPNKASRYAKFPTILPTSAVTVVAVERVS